MLRLFSLYNYFMHLPNLKDANIKGKTVFLRADLDIPLVNGKIEDDFRLLSAIPTIKYILKQNCKIIIAGHLGRPDLNQESRIRNPHFAEASRGKQELSLKPVAEWFAKKLSHDSSFIIHDSSLGGLEGWEIGQNIFLLENLRFYKEEKANDPEFSKKLASLTDIYVNEAFANSHRNHASIAGVPKYLPHFAGLHLEREVEVLSGILKNPKRPLVVIIGGAKIETKLPLIEKMHKIADYVLVGGKLADETKTLLKIQHEKINSSSEKKSALLIADLNTDRSDITLKSAENFLQILNLAKTVVWNGPMGKISDDKSVIADSEQGTKKLAEGLIRNSAFVVVGGGDTVGFLKKICLLETFACLPKARSHLSTGGGAMLSLLSGEKLPGIEALL